MDNPLLDKLENDVKKLKLFYVRAKFDLMLYKVLRDPEYFAFTDEQAFWFVQKDTQEMLDIGKKLGKKQYASIKAAVDILDRDFNSAS